MISLISRSLKKHSFISLIAFVSFSFLLSACGGTSTGNPILSEDSSVSGTAASAAGGALGGSGSSGTLAFLEPVKHQGFMERAFCELNPISKNAFASQACPTYSTAQGSGCTASGSSMWLTYDNCSFAGGSANWFGTQSLIESTGSASCGTFPYAGPSTSLYRQLTQGATSTPGSAVVTSSYGTAATINDEVSNLGNFDGDTITTVLNSGYGDKIDFNASGQRHAITIGHRLIVSGVFDHSITGALTITEATGASSRRINGTISVYHNALQIVGVATFNNVLHQDGCCLPVSGTITTVFSAGDSVAPTTAGSKYVGKSETLTLTGCGTGTLQAYDGSQQDVALSRCF